MSDLTAAPEPQAERQQPAPARTAGRIRRSPDLGASATGSHATAVGLADAVAGARATSGPRAPTGVGRIQRSAMAGRDASGVIRRETPTVDIALDNARREETRLRLEVETTLLTHHLELLASSLTTVHAMSTAAVAQPAQMEGLVATRMIAAQHVEQVASHFERFTALVDQRRPQVLSIVGKINLDLLDTVIAELETDLMQWRGMVPALPPGSGQEVVIMQRAQYFRARIVGHIGAVVEKNVDELNDVPTAPPPPPVAE